MIPDDIEQKREAAIQQTHEILAQLDELEPKLTEEEIAVELHKPKTGGR